MKIDYVVVSTDNNPFYNGYWEIAQKTWKQVVGVKTILVTVGDENYHKVFDDYELIGYKKVDDIPTSFQSQVSRLFVTKTYPDKTFLTSDLDMIPLSKSYFVDNAERFDNNTLLIYSADAYGYNNQNRYPMCYNLATGKVYNEIMDLNCSYEEFIHRLYSLKIEPLWDTDELFWGKCVSEFEKNPNNQNRIAKLHRGWPRGAQHRLDRDYWGYDVNHVREGHYIDSHLLRPYESNKVEIDTLLSHLNHQNNISDDIPNDIPRGKNEDWGNDNLRFDYPLNENSIVIDLGGYEGWFTDAIYSLYNCNVYCFEPIDSHYETCENKFKGIEKIKLYKTGLADDNKLVNFHVANDSSSIHIGNGLGQFNTNLIKIDDFMSQENINYVNLLKLNIEGAEYDLLEHMIKNDLITKFENIQVQFHEDPYDGWEEQYKFIIDNLKKTHHLTYHFEFKFENWKINK